MIRNKTTRKITIDNYQFIFSQDGVYPYKDNFNFADPTCISAITHAVEIYKKYGVGWEMSYVYIGESGELRNFYFPVYKDRIYKIGSSYHPETRTNPIHAIPFIDRKEAFQFEFALHIYLNYYALGEEFFELPDQVLESLLQCHSKNDLCDLFGIPYDIDSQVVTKIMSEKYHHYGKVKKHDRFVPYHLSVPIDPSELKKRHRISAYREMRKELKNG